MRIPSWRRPAPTALFVLVVTTAAACSSDGATGPGGAGATGEVAQYLSTLPGWAAFAPAEAPLPPTPDPAGTQTLPDTQVTVRRIEDDSTVTVIPDVTYQCQSVPYTVRDNPTQIVMYNPDRSILWPGGMIQGRSHRDGAGSLLPLTIAQRAPIEVSIPALANNDNFREVDTPTQAEVDQAIGSMIGAATRDGLDTPSSIVFTMESYHSESQFALGIKASGRYLGFRAKATGDFSRNAAETTVTAQFVQRMYTVVVAPPQTPGAWFSSDFTQARLDEQVRAGTMGPDNLPVYVSEVVYGRMMMFSFTSTASETEIRATLEAAYRGIGGSAQGSLDAKQRQILREAKIGIVSLGGPADATIAMIKSGDWSQYFTRSAALSTAEPLSYTFRNLSDGSIASVTETTNYNVKSCTPVPATPGSFAFLPMTTTAMPVPTPARTLTGDFNGDGRTDFVFNHAGASNQTVVAFASGDGGFTYSTPVTHPETPTEGWTNFETLVADVDGDGTDDLVWNVRTTTANRTYLGISRGDGTFSFPAARAHPVGINWTRYRPLALDLNGDGRDDLAWNDLNASYNWVYAGLTTPSLTFDTPAFWQLVGGWSPYVAYAGSVDGNATQDLIFNTRSGTNRTYFARSNGAGSFTPSLPIDNVRRSGWSTFAARAADVTGDGRTDLVWVDTSAAGTQVSVGITNASGTGMTFPALQVRSGEDTVAKVLRIADINGDGIGDLVLNTTGTINRTYVGLGTSSGAFDFSPLAQLHPDNGVTWSQFTPYVGDVNGDGRDDVIWIHPAATIRIFVALARP